MKLTQIYILSALIYLPLGFLLGRGNRRVGMYYAVLTPLLLMSYELLLAILVFSIPLLLILVSMFLSCLFGFIGGWLGKRSLKNSPSALGE